MYIEHIAQVNYRDFGTFYLARTLVLVSSPPPAHPDYLKCQRGEGWVNGRSKCLDKVAMSTAWSRKNCDKNICMLNSSPFSVSCHLFSLFFASPTTTAFKLQSADTVHGHTNTHTHTMHTQYTQWEGEGDRRAQFNSICWANVAFVNRTNRKLQNYSDIDWIAGRRAKGRGMKERRSSWQHEPDQRPAV